MSKVDINPSNDLNIGGDVVGRDKITNIVYNYIPAEQQSAEKQQPKKRCFVIMPFSGNKKHSEDYWTDFFNNLIKPSMEELGYVCERAIAKSSQIIKEILVELLESDIVLAVLTDYNPNVWYELGVRHSFRNGTIMIIEKGQDIPFDIKPYGVIQYKETIAGKADFERQLKIFVSDIEKSAKVDSPVKDFFFKAPKNLLKLCQTLNSRLLFSTKRSEKQNKD